jgi:hypothetical protein
MATHPCRNYLLAAALLLGAVASFAWYGRSAGSSVVQDKKPDLTEAKYYGVSTCNKCHADSADGKPGKFATDFVLMNEFTTWRSKDKHALAYIVLEGPRGQQIGKILNIDVTKDAQCLNCHSTTSRQDRKGKGFSNIDGVSCDGCHGPAQHWIIDHALDPDNWRIKTPEEKEELGMYDVRNPLKRTQLCASCHIGNAAEGKVVTHAMFAAGHPPLPSFEVASFSRNMPQHWSNFRDVEFFKKADAKVRKQNYGDDAEFQNTKLMVVGGMDSLRSMMELVTQRATLDGNVAVKSTAWPPPWLKPFAKNEPHERWPELEKKAPKSEELLTLWPEIMMAQADCYACHHELKSKSWRQVRGYPGKPGRPQLQPWPFALASLTVADDPKDFVAQHKKLVAAFDAQPFGVPKDVAAATAELESFASRRKGPPTVDREAATKLLKVLLVKGSTEILDYDSARQVAWATRVVYGELHKSTDRAKAIDDVFGKLDNELNLSLDSEARKSFVNERYAFTKELAKSDKEFAARAKDQAFLSALQKINDRELSESLRRISEYDPMWFKTRMEELARLLSNH